MADTQPTDAPTGQEAPVNRACIIGGGAFGTALGLVLAKKSTEVRIWVRHEDQADKVNEMRCNQKYLPGYPLPENVIFGDDVKWATETPCDIVLLALPSQFLRGFLEKNRSTLPVGVPLVLCAKGIEVGSLQTPFEIMQDELPGKYGKYMAVLSGPSFAKEMAEGQPTNVSVAADLAEVAEKVQQLMSCRKGSFRVYTVPDVIGCEVAGAVKNVLAIASGASAGCGFGNNTRAALICRGLAEMTRLAIAMGASGKSMPGLAGVGDLLLTCSSELSRNFTVGLRLAKGETLEEIKATSVAVAEGVATAMSLNELCKKVGVDMPICSEVFKVLYEGKSVIRALSDLQERPLKPEDPLES